MTTRQIFRGRTLTDARRAAEMAFGCNAVLLTMREVRRPGLAGLFGTMDVEVVATPEVSHDLPPAAPAATRRPASSKLFSRDAYVAPEARTAPPAPTPDPRPAPPRDRAPAASVAALRSELRSELRALKTTVTPNERAPNELVSEIASLRAMIEEITPDGRKGDPVLGLMREQGLDGAVAAQITRSLRQRGDDDRRPAPERLREALSEVIRVAPWPLADQGRAVIAMAGPAGVGKTTTLAKLAAHARMARRTVTLISCDGFRVGAVEQLQRYATLLGSRFEAANSRSELTDALGRADTDLVFIDFAGSIPRTEGAESLIAESAFTFREFTRHLLLCVPATLREHDAKNIAQAFAPLGPTALAITKLDETTAPSGIAHATVASQLPVSVLCTGQNVPENIAQATASAILDQLVPRSAFHGA